MFGSLFRQAQETVDSAIYGLVNRLMIALPLLVALGFTTAAIAVWLYREFDGITANLILAAGFAAIGLIAAMVLNSNQQQSATSDDSSTASNDTTTAGDQASTAGAKVDSELLMSTLRSAAPIAVPPMLRGAARNWQLILALAIGAVVVAQTAIAATSDDTADGTAASEGSAASAG